MKDRRLFGEKLKLLIAVFGREPSEELMDGYWKGVADLSDEEFIAATDRALRDCRFMPVPAELRAFARPSGSFVPSDLPENG